MTAAAGECRPLRPPRWGCDPRLSHRRRYYNVTDDTQIECPVSPIPPHPDEAPTTPRLKGNPMTRKDYELIAAALCTARSSADFAGQQGVMLATDIIAIALGADNKNFNRERFISAARCDTQVSTVE